MKKNVASFPSLLLKKGKIKEQFYLAIKELILNGQLKAGRKLPSSRTLSEMMSISRNSILSGLERLSDEGYLITKKGSGTYVTSTIPDEVIQIKSISPYKNISNENGATNINPHMKVMKKIWDMTSPYSGNNMKFNIGIGCIDLFPHELWGRLLGRVWRQFRHQDWNLNEPLGYKPLRVAISEYVRTTRGLNCTDEQILIVNGTQQAINLAAQVLLQKGDEVWLDEPGYDGALGAFTAMGAKICPVISDENGMDISYAIKHWPHAKMIFTSPSHQFPLGGTLSLSRRIALLDWASENKMWIFEDDYNSEFRYKAQPIQALQGLDKQQRVIYAGSFSKMMFPGFHLGFLVIPESLVESFKIAKYYADTRTSYLEQTILATFIAEGHYARHVRRVRKACHERQQVMIEAIQIYLPEIILAEPSDSGIHIVCWLSEKIQESFIIEQCRKAGLGAQPLSRYCQIKPTNGAILLGFAAHSPLEIVEGIKKLAQILTR
ncbi:GntR family transcriptional regulator [Yersinia rohdei]|uniref:MocR-like pyridoxine biosynthesis transcription factor PdxR n=1 Tax=Yersinia rohdei TaxID=29485 RepID=UPI0005E79BFD|nr:PLP-dependent aminotransferase family protein [Yersinia rohdei]MDN0096498.1 PLP-dependent aminotransferase family protein [Yersinia rohdei]CNI79413.1 GntR family transcriptional regulator [Yersinia rohdei]